MISCDNQSDAKRNTECHKQRIEHPHGTSDVVLIRNITDGVREIDTGHQRNNRTDDNLVQMMADPRLIQKNGNQRDKRAAIFDILPRSRYSR